MRNNLMIISKEIIILVDKLTQNQIIQIDSIHYHF